MGIHQWARVMASLLQGELERARLRKALQDLDLDQLHLSLAWLHGAGLSLIQFFNMMIHHPRRSRMRPKYSFYDRELVCIAISLSYRV